MADSNQVGKRYVCQECGTTVICVKSGAGKLACHRSPMDLLAAKPLPATD
jgi:hypothetical protein